MRSLGWGTTLEFHGICDEGVHVRYDCSFGTSPKASTRIQSIAGACETRVKILDETLRELEGGKIAMLEEELVSTDVR